MAKYRLRHTKYLAIVCPIAVIELNACKMEVANSLYLLAHPLNYTSWQIPVPFEIVSENAQDTVHA